MKLEAPDFTFLTPGIKGESFQIQPSVSIPVWSCDRAIYHIVFHLVDSLPRAVRDRLLAEREEMLLALRTAGHEPTEEEVARAQYLFSEKLDAYLDAGNGAAFMRSPAVAEMVMNALLFGNGSSYALYEFAVMPNHVHFIAGFESGDSVKTTLTRIKSYTAREINRIVDRQGAVWAVSSYNRIVRTEEEYRQTRDYVRKNPERAGLVGWKWVSEA